MGVNSAENLICFSPDKVGVYPAGSEYLPRAEALAERIGSFVSCSGQSNVPLLRIDENGLSLTGGGLSIQGDLTRMLPRLKQANLSGEMLVRASRIKGADYPLTAVDATAGLGEDSVLLAAAGFNVIMFEYNPVIAALLEDSLERARVAPGLSEIAGRMSLEWGSSIEMMPHITPHPDVILLDPMFPERQKSALIKKKFQLLQQLESPCSEEEELFAAAVLAHPRKIVIKRPLKGQFLAGRKPEYSLRGKAIRYDCFTFAV